MPKFVALNRTEHSTKTWKRAEDFRFAARDQLAPLVAPEAAAAAAEMPFGFVISGGKFELAALLSFNSGENAFIGPDGKWMMRYVPLVLRGHPFRIARQPGSDQAALCVDVESECFGTGEEQFFNPDGSPSEAVQQAIKFQTSLEAMQLHTAAAVAALAEANLIVPWEIKARIAELERPVVGFHRIDQHLLERLDDEAHLRLRKANAIGIAYSQIVSMHQLNTVQRLTEMQERLRKNPSNTLTPEQIAGFLSRDDSLIF